MKAFRGRKVLTSLVTLAVAAVGAASLSREYLSENGFQPFDTNRELQNKQVLFPDGV